MKNNTADFLIRKARTQLIMTQPFFGALALRLQLEETTNLPFPTMATDGITLKYHPDFVLGMKDKSKQLEAAVCHEVMHCAMGHPWRMLGMGGDGRGEVGGKGTDNKPFDLAKHMRKLIATDLAINPLIRDAGLTLPEGSLYPAMFKLPEGLSAEEYYRRLPADPPNQKQAKASACSVCSGVQDMPGGQGKGKGKGEDGEEEGDGDGSGSGNPNRRPSASEIAVMESEWQIAVVQAAQAARAAGKLPAGLERFIDEVGKPQVDWREVLRRFINSQSNDDYRMFPPNRRFIWQNIYLPSLRSESMGEVVVAIDTSGSIGQKELAEFVGELNGICEDAKPRKVHVLSCDAKVHTHAEFTPDQYPITAAMAKEYKLGAGGGGTDFKPVFELVREKGIEPVCLVYLTDMYGIDWPVEADYPVLWAATTDVVAPWGETVRVKAREVEE